MKLFVITFISVLLIVNFVYAEQAITKSNVTVRECPAIDCKAIYWLKSGVAVQISETKNNWAKVITPSGKTGWIDMSLLQKTSETNSFTTTARQDKKDWVMNALNFNQKSKEEKICSSYNIANLYAEVKVNPDIRSQTVEILQQGSTVNTVEEAGAFLKVVTPSGKIGYIRKIDLMPATTCETSLSSLIEQKTENKEEPFKEIPEGEFPDTIRMIGPEKTTAVKMSSIDINRIVCPEDIKDVIYSEEKGIIVKVSGKHAFLKFQIKKIGETIQFSKTPADLYVVCGQNVYSIIAVPDRIPAVSVYLEDKGRKIAQAVKSIEGMPFEKKILQIVKNVYTGKVEENYLWVASKENINLYNNLDISMKGYFDIEGEGLRVKIYKVTAKETVSIKESDFLRTEISVSPVAVSLDTLKLAKGESATLIIVERRLM